MLHAFIDESGRRRSGESTCTYTLAAVLVSSYDLGTVRERMESLKYGKAPRVHWREERPARKRVIADAVAEMPLTGVVAVCLHDAEIKGERARRLCLVRLLAELSSRGVDEATFETRNEQDRADLSVLTGLRRSASIRPGMSISWLPPADPALWAADVIAGAVSWWLDGDGQYWPRLSPLIDLIDIDP